MNNSTLKKIIGTGMVLLLMVTGSKAQTVTVDANTVHQSIRGFGGINMPGWIADLTTDQVNKAFGNAPGQIGLSILRMRVPYDNTAFKLEIPTALLAKNLGATLFASPWSPPPALKSNNNFVGGSLNTASYGAYADYLLSFADTMSKYGASLHAISIQNEPDYSVTYESCNWTATELLNFVKTQGSKFSNIKLIAAEAFQFNQSITDPILNDAAAEPLLDIIGGHIYGGGLADYALARSKGKEVWMTEHYINSQISANDWNGALEVAKELNDCMLVNYNAYIWWYIRRSYGFIDESGDITKRGYVMSQFSKFIRPGYTRVGTSTNAVPNVDITAYKTDTSLVIVAVNRNQTATNVNFTVQNMTVDSVLQYTTSSTKNVVNDGTIKLTTGAFSASLDALSITTFTTETKYGGKKSNIAPVASAGADQEVSDTDNNGTESITLSGSASADSDGSISNYSWAEAGVQIASGASPSLNLKTGTHEIVLTVTDNDGATHRDTVSVKVNLAANLNEAHIWLEAECGTVGSNWNTLTDATASHNLYVAVKTGNNSTAAASENAIDQVSLSIEITEPGTYRLWARVKVPSANDDSYWVKMDDGAWTTWNGISGSSAWQWDDLHDSNNGNNVVTYALAAGTHTLKIAYREDGALLDKLYLTNTGTIPADLGTNANNCPPNLPPLAKAGNDQTVIDTDNNGTQQVTLNGSTSTDSDGTIASFSWKENDNQIATGATASVNLSVGVHTIVLVVTDNIGDTGKDTVIITVNANPNAINTIEGASLYDLNIYPNPTKGESVIEYTLEKPEFVQIAILDINGKLILTLVNSIQQSGKVHIDLNLIDLASGIYYCKFKVGNYIQTKPVIISK